MSLQRSDYNYTYPEELIAAHPLPDRSASKLLVLNRKTGQIEHQQFKNIAQFFNEGDCLVFNNSKVIPARLETTRSTGGRQEVLLVRPKDSDLKEWHVLINASKKVKNDDVFTWPNLQITIVSGEGPNRLARLDYSGSLYKILDEIGSMPLPPYMKRDGEESDKKTYQTVYAKSEGSVAAPTAGLHFTPEILEQIKNKGVEILELTLHVGPGTFLPVKTESILDHQMHEEHYQISKEVVNALRKAKNEKRCITAVGTTSTRTLESLAEKILNPDFSSQDLYGSTQIFIHPPYQFKIIDRLITNFHQPESTLLMLVSALASREKILHAYKEAIEHHYRLFSYGDSMLIG